MLDLVPILYPPPPSLCDCEHNQTPSLGSVNSTLVEDCVSACMDVTTPPPLSGVWGLLANIYGESTRLQAQEIILQKIQNIRLAVV